MKKLTGKLDYTADLFRSSKENLFAGQKLTFKNRNSGIERIEDEIRSTFVFPPIADD
jgi:hypothetical protein